MLQITTCKLSVPSKHRLGILRQLKAAQMYVVLNPLRDVRLYYQYLHMHKTLKLMGFHSLSVQPLETRRHSKQTYLQHRKEKNYIHITGNIRY